MPYNKAYRSIEEAEEHGCSACYNKNHRNNFLPGTGILARHYNEDSDAGTKFAANLYGQYQLVKVGTALEAKLFAKERFIVVVSVLRNILSHCRFSSLIR